jgi:PAS domain-containing protein
LDLPAIEPLNNIEEEDSKDIELQLIRKQIIDEHLALKALDGFMLVLCDEGDITYVSENICEILGLSKVSKEF